MSKYILHGANGQKKEFDGDKFPRFLEEFQSENCRGLRCKDCLLDCTYCTEFCGNTINRKFKDCKLEKIGAEEKTYNLLELEIGELYTCDECNTKGVTFTRNQDRAFLISKNGEKVELISVYIFKTFRKIKKELKFSDLMVGETYRHDGNVKSNETVIAFVDTNDGEKAVITFSLDNNEACAWAESDIKNWRKVK